jgi:FMN-dependent NADH-azoreductase
MRIFHVDASPKRDWSNSRALARHFLDRLRARRPDVTVDYLDLAAEVPAHPDELFTMAMYTPPAERTPAMAERLAASDALCRQMLDADALLFALPMYNFTIPSAFKAFVDNVVRAWLTFEPTADGRYVGRLSRQQALFITTRGSDLRPGTPAAAWDQLTPALRTAFGFIGVADPQFVDAQPLQFADRPARDAALARARAELDARAAAWAGVESGRHPAHAA